MKIYLVGGAVRDQLLGYPVHERDWVVVGATPQEMLDLGYRPVGKDFPVFLHPVTHEEYALARTERKTAPGYKGFHFYAAADVTLEEDLRRRDLTINAMAQAPDGQIIDPYGGQRDLQARLLRHVSPAFAEDPVRILRIARFSARFGDFMIHPDTLQLMQEMVDRGEVNALVAERVWQEWERALREPYPEKFFYVMTYCGALAILFPELSGNIAAGLVALQRAAQRQLPTVIRFAVLFWTLNIENIRAISQRYRVPKDYQDLALLVWGGYSDYDKVDTLDAVSRLNLLERLDALRRSERLDLFLAACEAIADDAMDCAKSSLLRKIFTAAKLVDIHDVLSENRPGAEIKEALRQRRLAAIQKITPQ